MFRLYMLLITNVIILIAGTKPGSTDSHIMGVSITLSIAAIAFYDLIKGKTK